MRRRATLVGTRKRPRGAASAILAVFVAAMFVAPPTQDRAVADGHAWDYTTDRPIQPGAPFVFWISDSERDASPTMKMATLGFVFTDEDGRLFVQGPAHILGPRGPLFIPGLGQVGTVVLWEDGGDFIRFGCDAGQAVRCTDDFALVEIEKEYYDEVNPSVRHWGGPTGVAAPADVKPGDVITLYGHAQGVREATRLRLGTVIDMDNSALSGLMPFAPGDNGGPVLHAASGKAVATSSVFQSDGPPVIGPTVERLLEVAAAKGLHLRLVTAPMRPLTPA